MCTIFEVQLDFWGIKIVILNLFFQKKKINRTKWKFSGKDDLKNTN